MKMLSITLTAAAMFAAACQPTASTNTQQNAALTGAVTGAALGAAVSKGNDRVKGALIGGAVGAAAGTLIGQAQTPGDCVYRDSYGRTLIAPCG